jgi:hypothetical protein
MVPKNDNACPVKKNAVFCFLLLCMLFYTLFIVSWSTGNPCGGRSAPAAGENPSGFHPIVKPVPDSGRKSAVAARAPPYGGCASPAGGENPLGFHPFQPGKSAGGQPEHPIMAAVLPLRARNAAIWGCSGCHGRCRIGER